MRKTMKKSIAVSLILGLVLSACGAKPDPKPEANETLETVSIKRDLLVLMTAYPGFFTSIQVTDGKVVLTLSDGKTLPYDDGYTKTEDQKFNDPDLQDMLEQLYPLSEATGIASDNNDPGRYRVYAFFDALYGDSKEATTANLIKVTYGTQSLKFSKINGAAAALQAASDEAAALAASTPSVSAYLYPSSGTYNYRDIAGTDNLSMHAYGIALDMKYNSQDYWLSADPVKAEARILNYPKAMVKIFESHGFIWGGKWHHFDTVHYEYRPEIILKAQWFSAPIDLTQPWATGADTGDTEVKALIKTIDDSLVALYETD